MGGEVIWLQSSEVELRKSFDLFFKPGKRHQVNGNIGEEWNLLAGRGLVNDDDDDDELQKVFLVLERVSCESNECGVE